MVRYTYLCEVCDEQETLTFGWADDAPPRMDCSVCGATGKMVKMPPKPANHFTPTKARMREKA